MLVSEEESTLSLMSHVRGLFNNLNDLGDMWVFDVKGEEEAPRETRIRE